MADTKRGVQPFVGRLESLRLHDADTRALVEIRRGTMATLAIGLAGRRPSSSRARHLLAGY